MHDKADRNGMGQMPLNMARSTGPAIVASKTTLTSKAEKMNRQATRVFGSRKVHKNTAASGVEHFLDVN